MNVEDAAKNVFVRMGSPTLFDLDSFKRAFAEVAHQHNIYHWSNRALYNYLFSGVQKAVSRHCKAAQQKLLADMLCARALEIFEFSGDRPSEDRRPCDDPCFGLTLDSSDLVDHTPYQEWSMQQPSAA
jgi:hypothetical protein